MPNITELAESALLNRQKLGAEFGPEAVRPSYDGLGLVNVAALAIEVLAPDLLERAEFGKAAPPLNPALLEEPAVEAAFRELLGRGPVNHVVLLLLDAMGYNQLKVEMALGSIPGWQSATENPANLYIPLTSVFPSTTTTALTAVTSARTPQEHGVMATTSYMPEVGTLVNFIRFGPTTGNASFTDAQVSLDDFVPVANIYRRLEAAGIETEQVNFYGYQNSSISRFTSARSQAKFIGYLTAPTAFAILRERLQTKPSDGSVKSFTYCYVSNIDTAAHRYGPLTPNYRAELAALDFSLNRELFQGLKGRSDILIMVIADHGQVAVDPQKVAWLNEHPALLRLMSAPLAGERRSGQLYIKAGKVEEAQRYINEQFGEHFLTLTKAEALEMGLFGLPGQAVSSQTEDRLGDLLMLPRGEWIVRQLYNADDKGPGSTGVHGGLSRAEMLIPFLAFRPE